MEHFSISDEMFKRMLNFRKVISSDDESPPKAMIIMAADVILRFLCALVEHLVINT